MNMRRYSKKINIGRVSLGGDSPIRVQSMVKVEAHNLQGIVTQIKELENYGCELVRLAIPDYESTQIFREVKRQVAIPLIADIHYDYRLALEAIKSGADGIRINPGNIRDVEHISAIAKAAKERIIPIRIGVNAGSLPETGNKQLTLTERMVEATHYYINLLEGMSFDLIKVSLKGFDVPSTVDAYRKIAVSIPYPIHVGITEAGLLLPGTIRSAIGIGILLSEGIGDTIRVSLTDNPILEVKVAYEILKSLNIREYGPVLVSCPTCGRTEVALMSIAGAIAEKLNGVKQPIKVAVMGCIVNGPGEAKDADVGVACGKGRGVIFKKGNVINTVKEEEIVEALVKQINEITKFNGEQQ